VIQQVPLSSAASNSWAAIFIKLISDRGGLIGITPEVDWIYQDQWGADKDWADKIAGSILFTANVWFSAFEADTLAPVSNQRWQLYQNSNLVNSLAGSSHSDSLKDKLFEINATPGQPYLMGVTIELVESNTIPSNAPPPPKGTFTTHAALNATVPSIWVSGAN